MLLLWMSKPRMFSHLGLTGCDWSIEDAVTDLSRREQLKTAEALDIWVEPRNQGPSVVGRR